MGSFTTGYCGFITSFGRRVSYSKSAASIFKRNVTVTTLKCAGAISAVCFDCPAGRWGSREKTCVTACTGIAEVNVLLPVGKKISKSLSRRGRWDGSVFVTVTVPTATVDSGNCFRCDEGLRIALFIPLSTGCGSKGGSCDQITADCDFCKDGWIGDKCHVKGILRYLWLQCTECAPGFYATVADRHCRVHCATRIVTRVRGSAGCERVTMRQSVKIGVRRTVTNRCVKDHRSLPYVSGYVVRRPLSVPWSVLRLGIVPVHAAPRVLGDDCNIKCPENCGPWAATRPGLPGGTRTTTEYTGKCTCVSGTNTARSVRVLAVTGAKISRLLVQCDIVTGRCLAGCLPEHIGDDCSDLIPERYGSYIPKDVVIGGFFGGVAIALLLGTICVCCCDRCKLKKWIRNEV
ncbi:hypothetical protein ScPMuIL_016967 [Solemya velum]